MSWNSVRRILAATLTLLTCSLASLAQRSEGSDNETLYVSGHPASESYLRSLLEERGWPQQNLRTLKPGESWRSTEGHRIINLDWTPPPVSVAALSDHPEEVDRRGLLFSGGLTALRPVRLQYYHLGSLVGPTPTLQLLLTNPGGSRARVHLTRVAGRPSLDYFSTGHQNNLAWFETQLRGEGEFLVLEPGASRIVFEQSMPQHKVVSGTVGLTLVEGSPLQFGLVAVPDSSEPASFNNLLKASDVHSRGFYPVAVQRFSRLHVIGQGETRVAVGGLRQETFSGVRELRGDYGVLYDVDLELHNPTSQAASVDLVFNPRGGAATGTFLLEQEILEVPLTQAFQEHIIETIELPPGGQRRFRLQTVPEGASSYPIRIILRDHPSGGAKITQEIPGTTEGNSPEILEIPHVRRVSTVEF